MKEQTESSIAKSGHDFGSFVSMESTFGLAHLHIFDVV
jgi:hypothetical protein